MRSRSNLINYSILIIRQNLVSDGIGSVTVDIEVRGVWLIYEVCYILIIGPKLF
jgi:hypothetical protein